MNWRYNSQVDIRVKSMNFDFSIPGRLCRVLSYPVKGVKTDVSTYFTKRHVFASMGFGMALLQNKEAREVYDSLPLNRQIEILDGVHKIQSKAEMRQYVASILELR